MYVLSELPYSHDALEPTVSSTTMQTHHGKHHKAYVDNTNRLAGELGMTDQPLEDLVRYAAENRQAKPKLFNNAGQTWNHGFFWESMTPQRSEPDADLSSAIQQSFGGLGELKSRFVDEGVNHFASGWVWIVARGGKLDVISTHDADTALVHDGTPVLVCDLWEHAYYLDYKQDRKGFLEKWFDTVANWKFAGEQLKAANGGGGGYRYPAPTAV